jgi:hypothetical protein
MTLTIDTEAKTITVITLNLQEAKSFAEIHGMGDYEVINHQKIGIPELDKYNPEAEFKLLSTKPDIKYRRGQI